jgi:uncharacterized protein (UPF0332 family)
MTDERYAAEELSEARRALADAERPVEVSSSEGIVNRLYYASFHAAQAALYVQGVDPGSHGAVRNRFGEEIVLDGDATREEGRLLTTLADLRRRADYGYDRIDTDVTVLATRTENLVERMTTFVERTAEDADDE